MQNVGLLVALRLNLVVVANLQYYFGSKLAPQSTNNTIP